MPSPKAGYRNAKGEKIPGTTTIIGKFKEAGGLIHWAWSLGMEGKDYREVRDAAADAGTLAHDAVESYIHKQPVKWPDGPAEKVEKAQMAFSAFLEWAEGSKLTVDRTEVQLVSEKYQFGGTLDAMFIQGKRSMGDWKTSNGIYTDYLVQLGAYGILWEENYPNDPIEGGFHLVRFDKTYGDFSHKWWSELEAAKKKFLCYREAYELDKELKKRIA
jgi:hypothetical protein